MTTTNESSSAGGFTRFCKWIMQTYPFQIIKSRSRQEWVLAFQELRSELYRKTTATAEKALTVGFLAGVLCVLFLKAVFFVAILLTVLCLLIWTIADEQQNSKD